MLGGVKINIKDVKRPDPSRYLELMTKSKGAYFNTVTYPVTFRKQELHIDKNGNILDPDIFNAIFKGQTIDLS